MSFKINSVTLVQPEYRLNKNSIYKSGKTTEINWQLTIQNTLMSTVALMKRQNIFTKSENVSSKIFSRAGCLRNIRKLTF